MRVGGLLLYIYRRGGGGKSVMFIKDFRIDWKVSPRIKSLETLMVITTVWVGEHTHEIIVLCRRIMYRTIWWNCEDKGGAEGGIH